MINLFLKTPTEINRIIADRVRGIRRQRKISQEKLALKSGVSLGSIKRFETTGQISLSSLVNISLALGIESDLENLFSTPEFESIEEVIRGQSK